MNQQIISTINDYRNNKTIMDFVTSEAREKVATEIRAKTGGGTTAKAVELLEIRHSNIAERVQAYVATGLIGCFMAGQKNA